MKGNLFEEAEIGIIILEVSKKGENSQKKAKWEEASVDYKSS